MNKKNTSTRRKVLKSIVIGSGAVVAGKSMPESWNKPVIDAVLLPSHAQTTTAEDAGSLGTDTPVEPAKPTYTIDCASLDVAAGRQCQPDAISFLVSGSVSASDGSSLEGVELIVSYDSLISDNGTDMTNGETGSYGIFETVSFSVFVGPANNFSSSELVAVPPANTRWGGSTGTIIVRFTDPAYGTSICTQEYACKGERPTDPAR